MHHGLTDVNSELIESLVKKVQEPAVLGRDRGRLPRVGEGSEEEETGAQRGISQGPGQPVAVRTLLTHCLVLLAPPS